MSQIMTVKADITRKPSRGGCDGLIGGATIISAKIILLLLLPLSLVSSLKVSVSIPELVKFNDAFWLNCSHEVTPLPVGGQQQQQQQQQRFSDIYAIKWYKEEEEFYRFLPNAEPKVSIYETNGVQLDRTRSHEGNVLVSKADVNSEGNYRCEVLSEAPSFETVRKSKHVKVYALPVRGPRVEILDSNGRPKSPKAQEISYTVGDKIELRCNSAPSKPAARLRWYLNDHELMVPSSNLSLPLELRQQSLYMPANTVGHSGQPLGYDVHVTPIEYRQHYKGIYSSHSTLSLKLQQDDLINSKISFKCLASMRQEVPIQSKQLIVLTPQSANSRTQLRRAKRSDLVADDSFGPQRRFKGQHNKQGSRYSLQQNGRLISQGDLIGSLLADPKSHILYVYEDSDTTLGPSIIDTPETLSGFVAARLNTSEPTNRSGNELGTSSNNYALEFNRADNLEYIQLVRDRLSRQRTLPSSNIVGANSAGSSHKRNYGSNSLVKSPLYLDEHDALRPIISWPPLEAGKLLLIPPAYTIVAIPTLAGQYSTSQNELKLVLPPKGDPVNVKDSHVRSNAPFIEDSNQLGQLLLERLIENLNCTCTEGSIDTRVGWLVNDINLNTRDTRLYPTRVSPDHRQTWITAGMQPITSQTMAGSLQSILSQYYKSPTTNTRSAALRHDSRQATVASSSPTVPPASNEHIRFICQAIHSMLLYSSSEMITFDFNPPPANQLDGNSIDKFQPLPSNVIQATSASQSSSSSTGRGYSVFTSRSQSIILLSSSVILSSVYITKFAIQGQLHSHVFDAIK